MRILIKMTFIVSGLLIFLSGCSTPHYDKLAGTKSYDLATRQLPPDPVYSRLKWVHLPEMYPSMMYKASEDRPRYFPVFHFQINNRELCDAAVQLAGTARYSSYCSSLLKGERITLQALGTIDELAKKIENSSSKVRVVVDHENREVRFLTNSAVEGQFFGRLEGENNG